MDLQEAFDAGFVAVKAYVDDALAAQQKALPDLIKAAVAEAFGALPAPKDGADGKDAPAVTDEQLGEVVRSYLEANPPAPGADGRDGNDGAAGIAGRDGVDGRDGEKGQDGKDGRDGCDATDAMIDRDGNLVVMFSDGRSKSLGLVVGRDGLDGARGADGRDGLTLANFDTALSDDGRTLLLSLEDADLKITHELQLPSMIYRGVFKGDAAYVQGDTVTFGGSLWHCNAQTSDKPIDGNPAWTLAAKRGRDGKDAKP